MKKLFQLALLFSLLGVGSATQTLTVTIAGDDTGANIVVSNRAGITTADINCTSASSPCVATVPTGSTVWLRATPSNTATFATWTGDCSGTYICQLTMSADKAVTATFTKTYDPYGGLLSVSCSASLRPTLATITQAVTGSTTPQAVTVSSTTPFYATTAGRAAPSVGTHTAVTINLGGSDVESMVITAIGVGTITAIIPTNHTINATLSAGEWQANKGCDSSGIRWSLVSPHNHPMMAMGFYVMTYIDTHNDNFAYDFSCSVSSTCNPTGTANTTSGGSAAADGAGTGKYGARYRSQMASAAMARYNYAGMSAVMDTFGDFHFVPEYITNVCGDTGYATDSEGFCTSKWRHPHISFLRPGTYALSQAINALVCPDGTSAGTSTCAVKNVVFGRDTSFSTISAVQLPDWVDSGFESWIERAFSGGQGGYMATVNAQPKVFNESPWLIAAIVDEADESQCTGAGADWVTNPSGRNHRHCAYTLFKTATHQAASTSPNTMIYADSENKSKVAMAAYLATLYANIAALNTAWGSSYTSFGTTGTQVTGEALVTAGGINWQGATAGALASGNVDKFSISIYDGTGKLIAGDIGTGSCKSNQTGQTTTSCTTNYQTGAFAFNPQIAVTGTPTVTYWHDGWGPGGAGGGGGTGVLDEDGRNSWLGTGTGVFLHGENGSAFNGNATMVADLDKAEEWLIGQYTSAVRTAIKKYAPNTLLICQTYFGNWQVPANAHLYKGIGSNCDIIGVDFGILSQKAAQSGSTEASGLTQLQFVTKNLGDVPFIFWDMPTANGVTGHNLTDTDFDASASASQPESAQNSQAGRGRRMYDLVKACATLAGYNGTIPCLGVEWWQWFNQHQGGQVYDNGFVTVRDNMKDGIENTQNAGTDSNGYASILEGVDVTHTGNYGDVVVWIRAARTFVNSVYTGTQNSGTTKTQNGGAATR